jgi:8-oxo-dGTP pyrophosphatase MutT (NUDIX family)
MTAHGHAGTPPRDAASIILVHAATPGASALLIRRHVDLAFAGGTWVFPGGKLEAADASPAAMRRLRRYQRTVHHNGGSAALSDELLVLMMAGTRETFEESGVLLARHEDGALLDADLVARLLSWRDDIARRPARFADMLEENRLYVDPSQFVFWAHWITPSAVARRYDTRFFVTPMPPGQHVQIDSMEATESRWLDLGSLSGMPDESLIPAPATRTSLADVAARLREHGSFERLLERESARDVIPIVPKLLQQDSRTVVLMPWDPDYASSPGDGTPVEFEIPSRYLGFPARIYPPAGTRMPGPA